jgi:glycosyltransferase involved in cell wall biosynthesis
MRILFDNVDVHSSSGPNSFGRKLIGELNRIGHVAGNNIENPDAQISFIQQSAKKAEKTALRLDGIYFNTRQKWEELNAPLMKSFQSSDLVIYQSEFNKRLTEKYFGTPASSVVINNGTSFDDIMEIPVASHPAIDSFDELWCCSSSWRPHKRLRENIRYFLENKKKNTGLIVLGDNPDFFIDDPSVVFAGKQTWESCISVYKKAKKFIHLAFLDHCPNVVVDARACGCDLVVASSGGTREIAGKNATVVRDLEWDLRPLDLYSPPPLNFYNTFTNDLDVSIDIQDVSKKYIDSLTRL